MFKTKYLACMLGLGAMLAGPAFAQAPGVTDDSIKIGIFGPMTGSAALFGKAVFGVEAVYKDVNDHGGINGRKIDIVREDTGCDPTRGTAAVKKLISQSQVFAINGGLCSGVVMAVKEEVAKAGVPFVIIGAASSAISDPMMPNLFHPVATTSNVAKTMIDFAMTREGTKKIAVVSHSDDWGKSNRDPAVDHLKEAYGLDPVLDLTMERGSSDATPQILKIRNADADFVVLMMYPAEVAIFLRDAYKYGLKVPVLAPQSISLKDTRERVGNDAAVENLYVFYPYAHPTDSPEMEKWGKLINKYYPDERVESFSYLGMSGALAVVEALKAAGPDLTRQKFMDALNDLRDFDSGISSAPITFTPEDHAGIKGGAMATLDDGKVTVMKKWQDK
ncbi:ABC transporter substrate-binding protein [Propylenella binzhouense]|uniref:Branched-chain amino acid ABC transporter substrate-binding protein n=1 Tax=Propylenella binzhouense TaxID=2555902 RepID=A0A964WRT8_9HYPH|nr:ABC transporter substrate-binding protein [Propylenella binzhouense]MYZ46252.1 branched-chain amino acid ABC transporter substrate-binding protein [Propylenella binzhouense]